MKKFARITALLLVAVLLCMALAACGSKPNEDPTSAKKSLKDAGYTIEFESIEDISSDPDDMIEALEGNGFSAKVTENEGNVVVTGTNVDSFETVTITYYENSADADAAYAELEQEMAELGELAALLGYSFGRSGNVVWSGTEEAVAAMNAAPYKGLTALLSAHKFDPALNNSIYSLKNMDGKTIAADCIKIYYFKDETSAENAFKKLESELNEWIEEMGDSLDDMRETALEEYDSTVKFDFTPGKATLEGCMIYVGTSGALKDAK